MKRSVQKHWSIQRSAFIETIQLSYQHSTISLQLLDPQKADTTLSFPSLHPYPSTLFPQKITHVVERYEPKIIRTGPASRVRAVSELVRFH